jgi:hypothetical protein
MALKKHRLLSTTDGMHYVQAWHVTSTGALDDLDVTVDDIGKIARVWDGGGSMAQWWIYLGQFTENEEGYSGNGTAGTKFWRRLDVIFAGAGEGGIEIQVGGGSLPGDSPHAARADHEHGLAADLPVAIGLANEEGSSSWVARADHVHDASAVLATKRDLLVTWRLLAEVATVLIDDAGKLLTPVVSEPVALTIPSNALVPIADGTLIDVLQRGTGQITFSTTDTLYVSPGFLPKTRGQYSAVRLRKFGTTAWILTGDLAPAYESAQAINEQVGTTYTLVVADLGKLVRLTNAAAITLTIPDTFSASAVGSRGLVNVEQGGAGQITVVGSGTRVIATNGLTNKSRGQGAELFLSLTGTTGCRVGGDVAAV